MPKHALIGFQTWHDWSWNIWSLVDFSKNFHIKSSAHKMAKRFDIENFFREIDPDLCLYMYSVPIPICTPFAKWFYLFTKKYWWEQDFQTTSRRRWQVPLITSHFQNEIIEINVAREGIEVVVESGSGLLRFIRWNFQRRLGANNTPSILTKFRQNIHSFLYL